MSEFIIPRQGYLQLNRRKFLGIGAGLVAAGLLPKAALALAQPHSFKQGAFDVTVISDGQILLPWSIVAPDAPQEEVKKLLGASIQGDNNVFETNIALVKAGKDLILFDTGSGKNFQPTAGMLVSGLTAAGHKPEDVTKVIITHAHPDHFWGTVGADGKLAFANASYHMSETELNFWSDKDLASKMPKDLGWVVEGAQKQISGFKERITTFKPGAELVTGITALDAAGHTPGHSAFHVAGDGGLLILADTVPTVSVQFAHPDWRFGFDADAATAIKNRKKLLDQAATDKLKMLGYHWPYPGLGHAVAKDGAFAYEALS